MTSKYDPERIRNRYNRLVEEEWNRLDSTPSDRISFQNHMHYLKKYIEPGNLVLEPGAGAGRFTVELVKMDAKVHVLDLSPGQLEKNKEIMEEMNLEHGIIERIQGDICDLSNYDDNMFDHIVCYGGPLSYVFEKKDLAMDEMLRILKPNGVLFLSVMSLIGTIHKFLKVTIDWSVENGLSDWDTVMETRDLTSEMGSEDHWLHMFRASELKEFFNKFDCELLHIAASNTLTNQNCEYLEELDTESEVWHALVKAEIDFCAEPGNVDSGTHIIAVVRKN